MDLNPLQQARQIRMTVRTMRIKAETAYLEAQRTAELGARTAGKPPFATHDARRPPLGH